MQEIKFRVYDKEEKCFHYFTLANILQYRKEFEKHIINGDKFDLFTGLHDKNGKEIYEGDIVNCDNGDKAVISWKENFASFCLNKKGWLFSHFFGEAFESNECLVIGNIHENPEIIKEVE